MLSAPDGPAGIGGWLFLVAFQVVAIPAQLLRTMVNNFDSLLSATTWHALTTPGGERYHPAWSTVIPIEWFVNATLLAVAILQAVLFFQKRRWFRGIYIGFLIGRTLCTVLDLALVQQIPVSVAGSYSQSYRALYQGIFAAAIWVPYLLVSVRVKRTFVD